MRYMTTLNVEYKTRNGKRKSFPMEVAIDWNATPQGRADTISLMMAKVDTLTNGKGRYLNFSEAQMVVS